MSPSRLQRHPQLASRFLPSKHDLIVYVPPGYEDELRRRFPVLYMHDGQNLFDGATSFVPGMYWRVGETADQLIADGEIEPLLIAGISNAAKQRVREYTPTRLLRLGGGRLDRHARMLLEEVRPFVESNYRALSGPAHTGLGGSSLGGLATLHIGLRFPHVFGKLAVLSPSVWWGNRWLHNFAAKTEVRPRPRIWMDIGTKEGTRVVQDVALFRDVLIKKGWVPGQDLHYEEIDGGTHDENAWARRVGPFLKYLFPPTGTTV